MAIGTGYKYNLPGHLGHARCYLVQGQYDRVHCGAACPTSKLGPLLDLLRPEGGLIVTPVEPSDLRVIIKKPDGAVTSRIISQVRYSTLEVSPPPPSRALSAGRTRTRTKAGFNLHRVTLCFQTSFTTFPPPRR